MKKIDETKKRVVLAYGEVTGHAHAFYGEDTVELDGNTLTVKEKDELKHEEHTTHVVEPGIGEVTIQKEYTQGIIRRTLD